MLVEYSSSSNSSESSDSDEPADLAGLVNVETDCRKRKQSPRCSLSPQSKHYRVNATSAETTDGKLPLPSAILSMFSSEKDGHQDNQNVHMGRVRSFAHERGNWASLVCIPLAANGDDLTSELVHSLADVLQPIATFHPVDELHISLSKTFVVRHHWIEEFVKGLRQNVSHCRHGIVRLSTVEFYCNEESTRTFLGITAFTAGNLLESYVKSIDSSLAEYQLPQYYENPSFHVSLLWALGDIKQKIDSSILKRLQEIVDDFFADNAEASTIVVKELKLKTGNKIFLLPLDQYR